MLFHVTHQHTEATCPYHDPERVAATLGRVLPAVAEAAVGLVGAWTDPVGHHVYFVLEAERYEDIQRVLDPIVDLGTAEFRPVREFAQAIAELSGGGD